ncbi:hypothetical protein ACIRRH_01790 [Kitasatospora sp. NPDC101235]
MIDVRLTAADPATRTVRFTAVQAFCPRPGSSPVRPRPVPPRHPDAPPT